MNVERAEKWAEILEQKEVFFVREVYAGQYKYTYIIS